MKRSMPARISKKRLEQLGRIPFSSINPKAQKPVTSPPPPCVVDYDIQSYIEKGQKPNRPPSKKKLDKLGYVAISSQLAKPQKSRITRQVRQQVKFRSGGVCEAVTSVCTGKGEHLHHRKLRRSLDNTAQNLLHVCFSCHRYIHDNPSTSYEKGWLLHIWENTGE